MTRITVAAFVLLMGGCARVVAPSGGPEDRTPPELFLVTPEPGLTDELPEKIVIRYSERISQDESCVEVYPVPAEVVFRDRQIEILPHDPSGVFSVTVSGQLQDVRGNSTKQPLTLVWNSVPEESFAGLGVSVTRTGGGSISETTRCDLFLIPDTVAPLLTQYPDSTGGFIAGWLPPGDYRLYCYEDNDGSRYWDPEREAGAMEDVLLFSGDTARVSMAMTIVDSIGPVISSVEPLDGWHIELMWNEQVTSPPMDGTPVTIAGPDGLPVRIYGLSSSAGRSSTGRTVVYTDHLQDTLYTVRVQGIQDLSGNPSLPDSLEFWAVDSMPSFDFALQSAYPEDGASGVSPSGPFFISFSDWVDPAALDSLYRVTRVFDGAAVSGSLTGTSPVAFSFYPELELSGEKQYRVDLDSGLVSLQGDTLGSRSWTFTPAWSNRPGSVSGVLSGISATEVLVVVASAGGGDLRFTGVYPRGEYAVANIPGGRYTVSCFVDRNGNEVWNTGEPYGAWPGVIEVFPGTETTGIDIQMVP